MYTYCACPNILHKTVISGDPANSDFLKEICVQLPLHATLLTFQYDQWHAYVPSSPIIIIVIVVYSTTLILASIPGRVFAFITVRLVVRL